MSTTEKVTAVGLVANNADRMLDFYEHALQLEKLQEVTAPPNPENTTRVAHIYGLGDLQVKIWVIDPMPPITEPAGKMGRTGMGFLSLRVADIEGLVARVTAHGYVVPEPPHRAASGAPLTMGWLQDPDGNWIELLQPDT